MKQHDSGTSSTPRVPDHRAYPLPKIFQTTCVCVCVCVCVCLPAASMSAAIESGDVSKVSEFLKRLFSKGVLQAAELKCMRRALTLLDTRWKAEVDRKRKATFSSEDKVRARLTTRRHVSCLL